MFSFSLHSVSPYIIMTQFPSATSSIAASDWAIWRQKPRRLRTPSVFWGCDSRGPPPRRKKKTLIHYPFFSAKFLAIQLLYSIHRRRFPTPHTSPFAFLLALPLSSKLPDIGCTGKEICAARRVLKNLSVVMKAIGKGISDSAGRSIERDPRLPASSIRPPGGPEKH